MYTINITYYTYLSQSQVKLSSGPLAGMEYDTSTRCTSWACRPIEYYKSRGASPMNNIIENRKLKKKM